MVVRSEQRFSGQRLIAEAAAWIAADFLLVACLAALAIAHFDHGAAFAAASLASFAALSGVLLAGLPRHHRHRRFGEANAVTLFRGAILCLIAGALAEAGVAPSAPDVDPLLPALLGAVVVSLDGLDGWLARRQKLASDFGARFDMEVDTVLILLLSIWVALEGKVGPWVLAIGAMRYTFVAASWGLPRLRAPLRDSFRRKAICVMQGLVLCLVLTPLVSPSVAPLLAAGALAALGWSFAVDIFYLTGGATLGLARSLVIYYAQPWRRRALKRLYREIVTPDMLIFDLGAHVGNRTRIMRALGARVVAVEPQPLFAGFLERTLPSDVAVLREAVGAARGISTLNISSRHPTVSTLSRGWIDEVGRTEGFRQVEWDRTVEVRTTTLDALIERFGMPGFVKIDVEGMEAEILAGLSRPVPALAFEALPAALPVADASIDRLERLGRYEFNFVEGETPRWEWPAWRDAADMRAALRTFSRDGRSGDVYARLAAPERSG